MRSNALASLLLLMSAWPAPGGQAQAFASAAPPNSHVPSFDVISVKPGKPAGPGGNTVLNYTPDGVHITNLPVVFLLRQAFSLDEDRLLGVPAWVKTTTYDIDAKVADADVAAVKNLTPAQRGEMLQSLLEQRFHLKIHHEIRDLSAYALIIAKGGSKLTPAKPEPGDAKGSRMMRMSGNGDLEAKGVSLEFMQRMLSQQLGRSIVDRTGLTGVYDFTLKWTPDPGMAAATHHDEPGATQSESNAPSIFTALEEQLGLKLEARKLPLDVIVIDHIEQPSAN